MPLFKRVRRRLFFFQVFLLIVGSCAVAFASLQVFDHDLRPEMSRKGELIATSLSGQFQRALALGESFARLRGVEELFRSMRAENPEIEFILAADDRQTKTFYAGEGDPSIGVAALAEVPAGAGPASARQSAMGSEAIAWADFLIIAKPISVDGARIGRILVAVNGRYVQEQMSEMFQDIIVVLVVSLLVTFELLLLIMANAAAPLMSLQQRLAQAIGAGRPADQSDADRARGPVRAPTVIHSIVARLNDEQGATTGPGAIAGSPHPIRNAVEQALTGLRSLGGGHGGATDRTAEHRTLLFVRMPLFVFFLAEELSRAFFPIFAGELYTQADGLPPELVISLPMMLFMLVVALAQPVCGPWAERLGSRRLMIIGALLGAAGLALTALAESFQTLLLWRLLTAVGYGMVFVAGQSHVVRHTDGQNRAWGLAMFVGSVLAASICGPAIGGILADRIGYRMTFAVGAGFALLSAAIALRMLRGHAETDATAVRPLRLHDVLVVLRNRRFLSLVMLAGMPAKIILTGFLYYLAPLYLADLGNSPSATGRIMMLYGLMMVLVTPVAAQLVDRTGRRLSFVVVGGLLSGLGIVAIYAWPSTAMMLVAVVCLGIAQAISITPQLALVPLACPRECEEIGQAAVMGFFRLFERIGSALGPPIAAFLLHGYGFVDAIVAIGVGVAGSCLLLPLVWRMPALTPSSPPGALSAKP